MSDIKNTKVVLFTSNGINGNIVYNFLKENYTVPLVVLDSPTSKSKMIKRRIKRLGIVKVFLQLVFMFFMTPLLSWESKSRKKDLLKNFDLDAITNCQETFKPESINDPKIIDRVNNLAPDLIVVCGTRLIQKKIIERLSPPLFNMHVGITPKYRGVHGGYWALVNKDEENFGVTMHYIDPGIDTGGVISQQRIRPNNRDNYATYPLIQVIAGLDCIREVVCQVKENAVKVVDTGLPSKLYYHPTIFQYVYQRIVNGIK